MRANSYVSKVLSRVYAPTENMQASVRPSIRANATVSISGISAIRAVDRLVQDPGPCFVLNVSAPDLFGAGGLYYSVDLSGTWQASGQDVFAPAIWSAMSSCQLENVGTQDDPKAFHFSFVYGNLAAGSAQNPFTPGNAHYQQADSLANHLVRAAASVLTAGLPDTAATVSYYGNVLPDQAMQALVQEVSYIMSSRSAIGTIIQTLVDSYGPVLSLDGPQMNALAWRSDFPKVLAHFTMNICMKHEITDGDGAVASTNDLWLVDIPLGIMIHFR